MSHSPQPAHPADPVRPAPGDQRLTRFLPEDEDPALLPPELERLVHGLAGAAPGSGAVGELLSGRDDTDSASVLRWATNHTLASSTRVLPPVLDDPYDWGCVAAAHAFSPVYATGGRPVLAVNLLGWPKALPADQAAQLLQGGLDVARDAGCQLGGTHPLGDDRPAYGLSVTGAGRPDAVLGTDAGVAGMPLTLTKPLGSGVLTRRHRATGEYFPQAVASMTALNHRAAEEALANGARGAVEVGDYGLLGHAYLLARGSGVTVVLDSAALPFLDGARTSPAHADCPRARRVLGWLGQHLVADGLPEEDALLLADPQISGGLLVAGEVPGFPVVGELLPRGEEAVAIR